MQFAKLAAGEQLCHRCTHWKLQHFKTLKSFTWKNTDFELWHSFSRGAICSCSKSSGWFVSTVTARIRYFVGTAEAQTLVLIWLQYDPDLKCKPKARLGKHRAALPNNYFDVLYNTPFKEHLPEDGQRWRKHVGGYAVYNTINLHMFIWNCWFYFSQWIIRAWSWIV